MEKINKKKLILIELNEINFDIVKKYIDSSSLKYFPLIVNQNTKTTLA